MADLNWTDVVNELENLIKHISKSYYSQKVYVDPSITPDDLYQVGMIKLFDCYMLYKHLPMDEFKMATKKALYREVYASCKSTKEFSIDNNEERRNEIPTETDFDKKELVVNVQKLYDSLRYKYSKQVLSELINPSQATINVMLQEVEDKKAKVKQGKKVYVPTGTEIKNWHIREALGLSRKQFDKALKEVREKAVIVFDIEDNYLR